MPLIKARTHRIPVVRHICRLQEPNRSALVLYALFIGDTVDYVLNQLIATTLAKDRDFVAWRAAQPVPADREAGVRRPARGAGASPRPRGYCEPCCSIASCSVLRWPASWACSGSRPGRFRRTIWSWL